MKEIKLGMKVRDRISGFSGIVVARCEWLYGCVRITVAPETTDKDNKLLEFAHFDEAQLEQVGEQIMPGVEAPDYARVSTGGPERESGKSRTNIR